MELLLCPRPQCPCIQMVSPGHIPLPFLPSLVCASPADMGLGAEVAEEQQGALREHFSAGNPSCMQVAHFSLFPQHLLGDAENVPRIYEARAECSQHHCLLHFSTSVHQYAA